MRITQQELNQIMPQIMEESGSLPDDIMAQCVSQKTGKECFVEDIRLYFEPTLQELEEEQRLIWEGQS